MTLALAIVRLSLVLENKDLLIFALSLDFARYLGTFDDRRTDLDISVIDDRQDLIKDNCLAFAGSQLLDRDDIALGDLILLAARLLVSQDLAVRLGKDALGVYNMKYYHSVKCLSSYFAHERMTRLMTNAIETSHMIQLTSLYLPTAVFMNT